jgi:hypothetical protein
MDQISHAVLETSGAISIDRDTTGDRLMLAPAVA